MAIGAPYRSLRGMTAVAALLAMGTVGCSAVSDAVDSAKEGAKKAARQNSVFSLDVSDCYNPNTKGEGEETLVEIVPCAEPHTGQVTGEFKITDKSKFPSDEEISTIADERCPVEVTKFSPDTWALPKGVALFYYTPTSASWATGDRKVTCTYTKDSGTFTGSLDKKLKPEQTAFLKGSNGVYNALWQNQPPKDTVEEDLPGYKKQAQAVAAALDAHVESLRGIDGTEVGKLRGQLTKTAADWKEAAKAGDVDTFYVAYDSAFSGIDPNKTVAARRELGLATTVPADDAEVWKG